MADLISSNSRPLGDGDPVSPTDQDLQKIHEIADMIKKMEQGGSKNKDYSALLMMIMPYMIGFRNDMAGESANLLKKINEMTSNTDDDVTGPDDPGGAGKPIPDSISWIDDDGNVHNIPIPKGDGLAQIEQMWNEARNQGYFGNIHSDRYKDSSGNLQHHDEFLRILKAREQFAKYFKDKINALSSKCDDPAFKGMGAGGMDALKQQLSAISSQLDDPKAGQSVDPWADPSHGDQVEYMDLTHLWERADPKGMGVTWDDNGQSTDPDPGILDPITTAFSVGKSQMTSFSSMGEQKVKYAVDQLNNDEGAFKTVYSQLVAFERVLVQNQKGQ